MDKLIKHIRKAQILSMSLSVIAMVFCTSMGIYVISSGGVIPGTICVILGLANAICLGNTFSTFKKE